jgi:hypothetical protein
MECNYSAFGTSECMMVLPPVVCYNSTSSPVARQTLQILRSGRLHNLHLRPLALYSMAYHCSYLPSYSYEIRSSLLQGMRDAIVSGSWLVWILSTACVYYVSRKYWSRQLVKYYRILRNKERSFVND